VLARLEAEPSVDAAEVDRRGELLRIRVRSNADVRGVIDRLLELGFASEPATDADAIAGRWYGVEDVRELSREEAYVIAGRVVPIFAQQASVDAHDVDGLTDVVATALYGCFIARTLDAEEPQGTLNAACGRAVEDAARSRLGQDRASALGMTVEADLATRSAFKE
jgi:hypothetical protein